MTIHNRQPRKFIFPGFFLCIFCIFLCFFALNLTFHEQDSKIKAKKKRQAVPCIEKSTGQDKGEIAMKILNGKVFENGKFVEKKVATDGSF